MAKSRGHQKVAEKLQKNNSFPRLKIATAAAVILFSIFFLNKRVNHPKEIVDNDGLKQKADRRIACAEKALGEAKMAREKGYFHEIAKILEGSCPEPPTTLGQQEGN